MASEHYGQVALSFWTDPRVKRVLTRDQKLLLLNLFTSPHSNMIGLYYMPLGYAADLTGIPVDEVRAAILGPLSAFVTYDETTEEVFVHGAAKRNLGDELKVGEKGPDNRIKSVKRLLDSVHSRRLLRAFLLKYGTPYKLDMPLPDDRQSPREGAKKGPRKPLQSPSEALAVLEQNSPEGVATPAAPQLTVMDGIPPTTAPGTWVQDAVALYGKHIGLIPHGRMGKALKPLVMQEGWPNVERWLAAYCKYAPLNRGPDKGDFSGSRDVRFCSPEKFVETYTEWRDTVDKKMFGEGAA